MKTKYGILVAFLAGTSLMVTSCNSAYPTYGGVAVGVGPGGVGVSASAEWTNASYDADGYPIYGYSYGRPVYGYTAAGVAIFTLAALTTAYYLPYWGCAHWCHRHDVYVHYCPRHCHRCWAPDRCPRGHHPHVRPSHDGPHPGRGVRVKEPSHRGVPDSGRPHMNGRDMGRNGGMNNHDMGRNGMQNGRDMGRNGGMNNHNMGRNGMQNMQGNRGVRNLPGNIQTYSPQRNGGNTMQQGTMQRGNRGMNTMQQGAMQRGMQNNTMQRGAMQRGMQNNTMQRGTMQRAVTPQGGAIRSYGPGASNRAALGGSRASMPSMPSSTSHRVSTPSFGGSRPSAPSMGGGSRGFGGGSHGSFGGGRSGGMGGGHFGGGGRGRR